MNEDGPTDAPLIRHLGLVPYESTWRAMQRFTDERDAATRDEIWFLEHPPVFTLGLNASREHLLAPGEIPVVQIDRGGQVTYHGPGQLVVYPLIDLRRHALGVRELVVALENAVIDYVAELGIAASGSRAAPGVYVNGAKLASIGSAHTPRRELPRPGIQYFARFAAVRSNQCVRPPRTCSHTPL